MHVKKITSAVDCGKNQCHSCWSGELCNEVKRCKLCSLDFCPECRFRHLRYSGWSNACSGCIEAISNILGEKIHEDHEHLRESLKKREEQNKEQQQEIEALRQQNKALQEKYDKLQSNVDTARYFLANH